MYNRFWKTTQVCVRAQVCAFVFFSAFLLFFSKLCVYAQDDETAAEMTFDAVSAFSAGGDFNLLTDGDLDTYVSLPAENSMTLDYEGPAGWFYFEWNEMPDEGYVIRQYTEDDQVIANDTFTADSGYINHGIQVSDRTRKLMLIAKGENGSLAEMYLYGTGDKPETVQIWRPRAGKTDLMIFSSHPDDEQIFFGTVLPIYAGEYGLTTNVVYMSHQKRLRQSEALAGLIVSGQKTYPTFAGFVDLYCRSVDDAADIWGKEETLNYVIGQLRRHKPEVVVTHGAGGEYGHGMHKFLAMTLYEAVSLAADESVDPDSAARYGTWQVKKLYLHEEDANAVVLPHDRPLDAFGGSTAFEIAQQGYDCHKSQHAYDFEVSLDKYSCATFHLVFSEVGHDRACDNLFENIPVEDFTNKAAGERLRLQDMKARGHRFLSPAVVVGIEGSLRYGRELRVGR